MNPENLLQAVLAEIAEDATPEAAALFVDAIVDYLASASRGEGLVCSPRPAEATDALFSEALPHSGKPLTEVIGKLRNDVLAHSLQLSHPMYMGPPVAPPLPVACWTESLIAAMNQTLATRAMSPTASALEGRLVRSFARMIGFGERSGGAFTSGASEGNFTALLAARAAIDPNASVNGVGAEPAVVLCGENAHSSVFRAVALLGLGAERAIRIPLKDLRMDTRALASRMQEISKSNKRMMAVVATMGAAGTGAFDELASISEICREHGVWLHVDGALGASALLSKKHRHRLLGIEHADSVSWDPHKMMLTPLSTSILVLRDDTALSRAFALERPSVERPSGTDSYGRSFMTSRRFDALKLWVALQRHGLDGLGALYDHLCELTLLLCDEIRARRDFEIFHTPDCNILVFRYIALTALEPARLDALNRLILRRLTESGRGFIVSSVVDGKFGLRATLMNPRTEKKHVHQLVQDIAEIGRQAVVTQVDEQ